MKYSFTYFLIVMFFFSCKDGNKTSQKNKKESTMNSFEISLLDVRDVNVDFNPNYRIKKFGVLKSNDSVYSYVFRLNDDITKQEVLSHSIGVKAYSYELNKDVEFINKGFSPEIEEIEGGKYILLEQKILNIKYIDSLEAFIFSRGNYKASGKLGTIKIFDILLEDE
ncbi:hypothetical protein [Corallibacter sp.]|uniref:hypothetical protein n=1 Tax=Corallibacter sp. TaxID=2038084 RepID=UPI003AB23C14